MKYVLLLGCLLWSVPSGTSQTRSPASPAPAKAAPATRFSGKVAETMDAASYTYVLLDTGTQKVWVAAPKLAVNAGDSVTVADAMPMRNFHSQTMKRDFDVIYFTGSVQVNGKTPAVNGQADELPPNYPPVTGSGAKAPVDLSAIKKAQGGNSVAEIYAGKAQLKGKVVKVRGKVVKYNPEVMGKNWVHIQDGTGSAGSNDLTVTTSSQTKVGDLVMVMGTVAADRDFGTGYRYELLIEDAKVTVE